MSQGKDFTSEQREKIQYYAPERLIEKLEKIMLLDFDEEYQKKYASQRLLVRDHVAQKIAEKVERVEQELHKQAKLSAEHAAQHKDFKNNIGNKISNKAFKGIWFRDENNQFLQQEDNQSDVLQSRVVASVKKCMPLFDIDSIAIDAASNAGDVEIGLIAGLNDHNSVSLTGNELPCLSYGTNFVVSISQQELDAIIAHECAHAKFRHNYDFPEYFTCQDAYHALAYYREKEADTHAALTFPVETESFFKRQLKISLTGMPLFNPGIKDNDPIKGSANNDVHPSYLLRYINALKIRKLLEAEQRWFATEEANERYGTVYYERAFQKMAEQESQGKRFISAFAQSYKNFSTP